MLRLQQLQESSKEVTEVLDKDTPLLDSAMAGLVAAQAAQITKNEGLEKSETAFLRLAAVLSLLMFTADMRGRRRLLLEARSVGADIPRAARRQVPLPTEIRAPSSFALLEAAARDILSREPKLALRASAVAKVYKEHGFAAARSARIEVTQAVQRSIARMTMRGEHEITASKILADLTGWTQAYAGTVYRTNLVTAYTAGRFMQARDPEVRRVAGAFELVVVDDDVTRRGRPEDRGEDHLAGQGVIASFEDAIWNEVSPPNGYNCRETLRLVGWQELEGRGLITEDRQVRRSLPANFSEFSPHPRFTGGRADSRIYGTAAV